MSTYIGRDGKTYSPTGLGFSLAYLPAVAITDMVYKYYNVAPPVHFPLESDWLIFLLASFTNSFFAAILGVVLFLYFLALKIKPKPALFMSIVSLFTTNLLVYSKHSVAHMMFITFLILSFFLVKKYSLSRKPIFLFFSAISYGIVILAYNQTFILSAPLLLLYYLMLVKPKLNSLKIITRDLLAFLIGVSPFIYTYVWFETTRAEPTVNMVTAAFYSTYITDILATMPFKVFIDGFWGQLFSPGRSFFLYTPLVLIIFIFWHKIRPQLKPELIIFLLLSVIYILFFSSQYGYRKADQYFAEMWHGESSWGPRYLSVLIPFAMLIVAKLYSTISNKYRLLIFLPLALFGLYIEFLGIFMPYQIKYQNLESRFFVNGVEYAVPIYSNYIPRFSPLYIQTKNLVKITRSFPKTLDHGLFNVRFYDGIDFPFNVGRERWRVIEESGYISFDDKLDNPIQKMAFGVINHPVGDSSSSAHIEFLLNNYPLLTKPETLILKERKLIEIPIKKEYLKPTDNQLVIKVQFKDPTIVKKHTQILGLISYSINNLPVNLESLDVPYVSPLGPKMTGKPYQNYGGTNQDLWKTWHIHTQIFERVPDFWWIKAMYYWDFPKQLFLAAFIINTSVVLLTGRKLYSMQKKLS
ncbi:MAG: hypothetical protein PHQ59_02800 [Candidatus Daviesbacteria bacterium]|nr:hypothetical protein [Candidatus Daviesbacteria bacterium]